MSSFKYIYIPVSTLEENHISKESAFQNSTKFQKFLKNFINDIVLGILFSLIAGIMLQISFCELLPTARRYNNKKYLLLFFVIGVIFMLFKFLF